MDIEPENLEVLSWEPWRYVLYQSDDSRIFLYLTIHISAVTFGFAVELNDDEKKSIEIDLEKFVDSMIASNKKIAKSREIPGFCNWKSRKSAMEHWKLKKKQLSKYDG